MRALLVMAAMLAASPAHAGWQYARWGMTSDQVKAAAKGQATPASDPRGAPDGQIILLRTDYLTPHVRYSVEFSFDQASGGLEEVILKPVNSNDCSKMTDDLRATYGQPTHTSSSNVYFLEQWDVPVQNNHIDMLEIGDVANLGSCTLTYRELGAKTGL